MIRTFQWCNRCEMKMPMEDHLCNCGHYNGLPDPKTEKIIHDRLIDINEIPIEDLPIVAAIAIDKLDTENLEDKTKDKGSST